MSKNKSNDLITDREMLFARLILSGTMTDQQAAEAAGIHPNNAAYTKSKPRVRAYMLEHRALMQQQLVDQEAEALRRKHQRREQVLDRLLEIGNMSSEMTRGSIAGQVKALELFVAIEGLIPDRRARSLENKPAPPLPQIHPADSLGEQEATTVPEKEDGPLSAEGADSSSDPTELAFADRLSFPETPSAIDENGFGRR